MHWRQTIRLKKHDYSRGGYYFLTFNTLRWRRLLSCVEDGRVYLTELGRRCEEALGDAPSVFEGVRIDAYVVMPDHVHMIVEISGLSEVGISALLRWLKSTTGKYYKAQGGEGALWQRGSYDVIVPDQEALERIREYIRRNPERWEAAHR